MIRRFVIAIRTFFESILVKQSSDRDYLRRSVLNAEYSLDSLISKSVAIDIEFVALKNVNGINDF